MNKTNLRNYARLVVRTGANVQKGQQVVINASVDDAYFVKYVVEEAYKAKASRVTVEWSCQDITKMNYKHQSIKTLTEMPEWVLKKREYAVEKLPAMIHILSEDPDGLKGIDQEKLLKVQRVVGPVMMKYREAMDNKYQWTIVGIPGEAWAKKIFPNLKKKQAIDALWDAIFKVTRVYGNAIENWDKHNANLAEKSSKLNDLHIKTLKYTSSNGTNFTVGLKECMKFEAGGAYTLGGVYYNPNMPTEECFTSPDKTTANGVVYATKPLSVHGVLVDNFAFRF